LINFIKKYWIELLVLGAIFAVLMIDLTPDITWINTDCDGPHYIYSAKYLYPSHKTSAPLYLLLGHVFLWIPFGTEAWRMALISGLSGFFGCLFIYLIIRSKSKHKWNRWFALIGTLIYGGSALSLSQNTIVESYPLLVTMCLGAYYFLIQKRYALTSVFLGCAGAIHPLALLVIIPMLIADKGLRNWKHLLIMGSFVLFYLYIPVTNRPPYMWNAPNSQGFLGFIQDTFSTGQMLSGGLSIWEFPKRIFDTILQLGLSFAVIGVVPLIIYFWKSNWYKDLLFWLFILPIVYYATDLAPQTYVYMQPSIAFGAIAIGLGLENIGKKFAGKVLTNNLSKVMLGICAVASIGFLCFNTNYFDIGRTLDKNMSAAEFRDKELSKVPDGQILLAQQGWEWAIVFPYNKDNNRNILPVCVGTLASPKYQDILHSWGIKFNIPDPNMKLNLVALQDYILKSIMDNNENVWTTVPTTPETYGAEIVPLKGNEEYLIQTPQSVIDGTMDMKWIWQPSNPYNITTGSIEVNQWIYIVFSNYSVLTFVMMSAIGAVPCWIGYMIIFKKKRWSLKKIIGKETEDAKV
jgi:hypothetical protein